VRIGLTGIFVGLALTGFQPVAALDYHSPPFYRIGQDLVDSCDIRTVEQANYCAGVYAAIEDRTAAARWKIKCYPLIHEVAGSFVPGELYNMLSAAKAHPEWLKLPIDVFVDKVERSQSCNGK